MSNNVAASVGQWLRNLAREFVLKGALLFELWTKDRHRPTRDEDFLAYGPNDVERFVRIFQEICSGEIGKDGLTFEIDAIAEKELANSRMKDFHDLSSLAALFPFDGMTLARAVAETFTQRKTDVPARLPPP